MAARKRSGLSTGFTIFQYFVCILLAVLSLMPFIIMMVNSTRSTESIMANAISFIPGKSLMTNYKVFDGKSFIDAILEPHRCYYKALRDLFET